MAQRNKLIRVFVGTEDTCLALLEELEKAGVMGMIRNEFQSAISAGFCDESPSALDLYIQESSLDIAKQIIEDFIRDNTV